MGISTPTTCLQRNFASLAKTSNVFAGESDNLSDECEINPEDDSWDSDDEVEEANTTDDLMKIIEGNC